MPLRFSTRDLYLYSFGLSRRLRRQVRTCLHIVGRHAHVVPHITRRGQSTWWGVYIITVGDHHYVRVALDGIFVDVALDDVKIRLLRRLRNRVYIRLR